MSGLLDIHLWLHPKTKRATRYTANLKADQDAEAYIDEAD
jgi:hypothetical protein